MKVPVLGGTDILGPPWSAGWRCLRGDVEDVAAAIDLAVEGDRAGGRVYNDAEPVAFAEAEWVRRAGEAAGRRGVVPVAVPGCIPVPHRLEQSMHTDSGRICRELGFAEAVEPGDAMRRTVAWERAHAPASPARGIGRLDDAGEDALLAELGGAGR